jgi:hypothetical protein
MQANEKQSVFQPCSAELAARPGGESAWPWCANATPARSSYLSCFSFSLCAWVNLRGVPDIDFENQPLEWLLVDSRPRHESGQGAERLIVACCAQEEGQLYDSQSCASSK